MRITRDSLVKPLILAIESGDGDVDDLQLSDRAMSAAGLDQNCCHRLQRKNFSIQLHLAFTFEHEIEFGHLFMIVRPGIFLDVNQVKGSDRIIRAGKGAPGEATGTTDRGSLVQLSDHIVGHKSE